MEEKLFILTIGILGTAFTFIMDHNDSIFQFVRYIPVVLSTAYIIWKWRKEHRK